MEDRGRWPVYPDLRFLSQPAERRISFLSSQGQSVYVRADGSGNEADAAAGVRARGAALLRAEFRERQLASGHQRVRGIRAGYDSGHQPAGVESGRALGLADVHHERIDLEPVISAGGEGSLSAVQFCAT